MTRRRARPKRGKRLVWREHSWLVVLLVIAGAVLIAGGIREAPKAVKKVWNLIGVHAVEGHAEVIREAAEEQALDPYLLAGIMYAESRGKVDAVSNKGALGLFQLVPAAAADAAKRLKLPEPTREELLSDARLNARLAASHLRWLLRNEGPDLERVLVAYNAGRAKLARWCQEAGGFEAWRDPAYPRKDGGALGYARAVLSFAERFRERGIIVPRAVEANATELKISSSDG